MGKINVYLPDDLEEQVRQSGLPLSKTVQDALRKALLEQGVIKPPCPYCGSTLKPQDSISIKTYLSR